jgi:hypothetical protein
MLELSEWIEPMLAIPLGCGVGQEDAWFRNLWNAPTEETPRTTAIRIVRAMSPGNGFAGSRTRLGRSQKFDGTPPGCYDRSAGWSSLVARWAHNPKVGGSNPPPATNFILLNRKGRRV